ncbi:hypothetical protein B0O80DRAFT_444164 [Mortierella sp. GBAus27b]|nr:hypothetical protein BGX31_009308 [Mortierella sp. GBA43]KAI8358175.1 hypothetical protein B0O80DRAFT_444164 [Mortierella sp. GBAus27b]
MSAPTTNQQTIRVHNDTSKPPVNITSRFDARTGRQVILWKDVQTIFKDAQYIRHGERALPFLVDNTFAELNPRRIEAFPGQVLEVVIEDSGPISSSASTSAPASASASASAPDPVFSQPKPPAIQTNSPSTPQSSITSGPRLNLPPQPSNNGNAGANDNGSNFGRSPQLVWSNFGPHGADRSRRESASPFGVEEDDDSQMNPTTTQLGRPQTFVDTGDVPRIQGYLSLVDTLEWHEAPCPRLFIVLPRTYVENMTPAYNTFRLFWMCEYMGDSSIAPHLDLHSGLDLDRPDEFFTKFGPHLLLNYQVFKYSRSNGIYDDIDQDEAVENTLEDGRQVSYDESIGFLESTLSMSREEIETSVDIMTEYIRAIVDGLPEATRGNKSIGSYYSQTWETEYLPQITPHDFAELESFLFKPGMMKTGLEQVHNLYRSTSSTGHVNWLCHNHLEHVHPFVKFGQTFMRNHGAPQYNAHAGQIIAMTGSQLAARLLYGILMSSPGFISELILHIGWSMSVEDLSHLKDVILRCRLVSLVLKGPGNYLASPAHSELILLTLSLSRLQSFTLENAQDILKNVNPLSFTSTFTSLRTIRLTVVTNGQDLNAIRIRLLLVILNSPNLKVLELEWMEMEKVYPKEAFIWELRKRAFKNLAVHLKVQDQEISVLIDRGQVRNVHLQISDLMSAGDNPHIYYGFVQSLTVKKHVNISDPSAETILQRILSACSALVSLTLTCDAINFSTAERTVRKMVRDLSPACALEQLILKEPAQQNITATFSLEGNQDDPMWDRNRRPVQVDVTVMDDHPGLDLILITYATVIRTLNTTHTQAPRQLTFVSKVILQEERSQLASLLIALDEEQWHERGFECVGQLFEGCSETLKQLTLVGYPPNLEDEDLFLKTLVEYKGRRLILAPNRQPSTGRTLHDHTVSIGQPSSSEEPRRRWIEKVKKAVSDDMVVITTENFEALCDIVPGITADNIGWLKYR